ncbi:MAG: L,D-transpeptidase [Gammaproteobacteria bacterium]|nr:L,D-transpeptidase [Gammaproteobacteria bacterium]
MLTRKIQLLIFLCCVVTMPVMAELHPEQRLLQALDAMQQADMKTAEHTLQSLIKDEPEFKLAHMLYADILSAHKGGIKPGQGLSDPVALDTLLTEVRKRWQAKNQRTYTEKIPAALGRLDNYYLNALAVDLKQSRLYVFENHDGYPRQVADFYISIGRAGSGKENQGDLRTPLGVYFVQSYIPPSQLADKYGAGAYPINYPNAWDDHNGRTGNGIWLHGTRSGTYNRPPLASEGCVVLPNDDLLEVGRFITLGQTPVVIGENLQWLDTDQWQQQKQQVNTIFTRWLDDWQSMNIDNYLSHYSETFSSGKRNFKAWAKHKRRIAGQKRFVDVKAKHLSLLLHPNENVLVATFNQHYHSDNFSSQSWKRQYWHKEADGQWRIIFEGRINAPVAQQLARVDNQ